MEWRHPIGNMIVKQGVSTIPVLQTNTLSYMLRNADCVVRRFVYVRCERVYWRQMQCKESAQGGCELRLKRLCSIQCRFGIG